MAAFTKFLELVDGFDYRQTHKMEEKKRKTLIVHFEVHSFDCLYLAIVFRKRKGNPTIIIIPIVESVHFMGYFSVEKSF